MTVSVFHDKYLGEAYFPMSVGLGRYMYVILAQNDRRQPADILSYFLAPTDTGK